MSLKTPKEVTDAIFYDLQGDMPGVDNWVRIVTAAVRARDKAVRLALLEEVVDRVTKGHAMNVKAPFVTAIQGLRAEIERGEL